MAKRKPKYYIRPDGLHETIRTINGKRIAFRGRTDLEVDRKLLAYTEQVETGRPFREVAEEWKSIHFPTLAANTLRGYNAPFHRAVAAFDMTPIRQITTADVRKFIAEFSRGDRASKTVTTQLLILNLIFSYALETGDVDNNPCVNISVPKRLKKGHREAASPEDEAIIKASAHIWLLPYFLLYTGLRKGEALAITYGDIDQKHSVIHVTKSVYYVNRQPYIKKPKTAAGIRTVPLLEPLGKKLPRSGKKSAYLFSSDGGASPLAEGEYEMAWKHFARQTGIQCTAHQLRHSYATMLFNLDIGVKDAQDILGHSTVAMTQDIYTHIRDSHREQVAQRINQKLLEAEKHSTDTETGQCTENT